MAIFVDPVVLTLIAILVSIAAAAVSKRAGLFLAALSFLFLYLIATPFVSGNLLAALASDRPAAAVSEDRPAAAIVILGADMRPRAREFNGDTVGRLSLERIRFGAHVYRATGLPVLTTGGRIGDSAKTVAGAMAEALRDDYRVPVRWIETGARNTFENAQLSATMLRREGIDTVYLVTHSWHMPRAAEAFAHFGIAAIARPTGTSQTTAPVNRFDFVPNSRAFRDSAFALHEWVGRFWYRLRYY